LFKALTIIGARPQIIKAAAISRAIRNNFSADMKEVIVHTGQHYDENMSKVFFEELQIPAPDHNLHVGSGSHGRQTALMLEGIEKVLLAEQPDAVIVYGDTNSTLAAAVAASKLNIPVVHVEAGLRSYNRTMPEEINRVVCDHLSTMLFSPTLAGYNNLVKEGFDRNMQPPFNPDRPKIYHCGDVMYDNSLHFSVVAGKKSAILTTNNLSPSGYVLATVHRNTNTDDPARLTSLFSTFDKISRDNRISFVIPLHPRTRNLMKDNITPSIYESVTANEFIKIIPPASFLDMISLEKNALLIMTDSGGVQKESFFFKKPCIVLRPETEWTELVENGNNMLADASQEKILSAWHILTTKKDFTFPDYYGDGHAAEFICGKILGHLKK
jgi:UDP-GlcNAc3NAcA epimerase